MIAMFVQTLILLVSLFGFCLAQEEPACSSKFEVELKLIEKYVQMEREISLLKDIISGQQTSINDLKYKSTVGGSKYIRWGRTVCPGNGTSLLYRGYMAGSYKEHTGTGANYLCLPNQPAWGHYDESIESLGKVTGVEYQFVNHRVDGAKKFLGDNMYNHKAPCAVCFASRGVSIMIPGRNVCYDGWKMEYSGYLVSGYQADKSATEYVCLDQRPEKVTNGNSDDNDHRIYFVESICGQSLACPPYVAGRELACVVCTI